MFFVGITYEASKRWQIFLIIFLDFISEKVNCCIGIGDFIIWSNITLCTLFLTFEIFNVLDIKASKGSFIIN
jgi:hypothetical protein